ncbi:carboxymuconolactone decarboxylase family protein [Parabacteroides sp. APC149_11_2_Y6]
MKKTFLISIFILSGFLPVFAQGNPESNETEKMDRTELCKKNYTTLFGGEALTGQGTDPEMMDILQKFIFGEVFRTGELDIKTREMITCITLATMQTLPQLKAHAAAALNVGVTPVELRETVYLCAPFIGFPKTLNALATINDVFKERGISLPLEAQGTVTEKDRNEKGAAIQNILYPEGIKDAMKNVPGGLGSDVERFLTEYCFGDIYTRNGLDIKTRELLAYCVLTTLEAESQLRSHLQGNLAVGNTKEILAAAIIQCLPYIGFPPAIKALKIIQETPLSSPENNMVRISRITVDPARLDNYNAYLKEEIEASVRLEPGVLTLYAVSEKEQPNKITILEIYADQTAYENHLQTPHFQKYKQGTLDMVQELELIDCTALIPGLKIK